MLGTFGFARIDVAIDRSEDRGKRAAIADAHSTLVTDLEDPLELAGEIGCVPIARVVGTESGRSGGSSRNLGHAHLLRSG
jgi:hypothetical protein